MTAITALKSVYISVDPQKSRHNFQTTGSNFLNFQHHVHVAPLYSTVLLIYMYIIISTVDPKVICTIISIVCHTKWCIVYGYVHAAQLLGSTDRKWTLVHTCVSCQIGNRSSLPFKILAWPPNVTCTKDLVTFYSTQGHLLPTDVMCSSCDLYTTADMHVPF